MPKHLVRDAIAGVLILSFNVIMFILFFKAIPESNKELIIYMLGQLSGFVAGIIAYHYSSTAGSEAKNALLAQKAPTDMNVEAQNVDIHPR